MKKFANLLVAWGPPGLFLLTLLDSAGVPIPGVVDALLVFLAAKTPSLWLLYGTLAVTGSVLGTMFLYFLARKGGEAFLDKRTAGGKGAKFKAWFQRYGLVTVFIPAVSVIPMPMKFTVFCAGAMGVPALRFGAVILAARLIRYFGLAWLGSQMGDGALPWIAAHKAAILTGLGALALVLFVLARLADRRRDMLEA